MDADQVVASMRRVDVMGGKHLSMVDRGEGRSTLLLLHGIPGYHGAWDKVLDLLPSGLRVLVPDLLGFGGSSRPSPDVGLHAESQAQVLVEALERMSISRVAVVGHDFGGPVALWMTRIRPDLVTHLGLPPTRCQTRRFPSLSRS